MFKKIIISVAVLIAAVTAGSQDLDSYLRQVAARNPEIISFGKLLEARRIEARTNMAPHDPEVSFGFLPGNSAAIGDKKIWSVNQSFAFPTKYLLQNKLNKSSVVLAGYEYAYAKMIVILDARLTFIDLIYRKKYLEVLQNRKNDFNKLLTTRKKMLSEGSSTIMDYNKIVLELSGLNLEISKTGSEIRSLTLKLLYMAGSDSSLPEIKAYPEDSIESIDSILQIKSAIHPAFLIPQAEYLLSVGEIKVIRTGSLPDLQVGYSSEAVPGEIYAGPVVGLSIPLWANSNKIKSAKARSEHIAASKDAELLRLKSEVVKEYERMLMLRSNLDEIREIIKTSGDLQQLETALHAGEITLTEYFSYLRGSYEAEDRLLEIENEYYKSIARINDHKMSSLPAE